MRLARLTFSLLLFFFVSTPARADSPTAPADQPSQIVHLRVWERMVPAARGWMSACEVGGTLRPAVGCLAAPVLGRSQARVSEGRVEIDLPRPAELAGRTFVVQSEIHHGSTRHGERSTDLETFLVEAGAKRIRATLAVPRKVPVAKSARNMLAVRTRRIPLATRRQTWASQPLRIPSGAQLQLHLAIREEAARHGASPTRFVVSFVSGDEQTILVDELLSPTGPPRWHRVSADLAKIAGQRGFLRFQGGPEPLGAGAYSAALFGAPMILVPGPHSAAPPNVILISLDTLRADHVGREREGRPLTPNLDVFAREGARFTRAMTTYPSTTASHMSLLTGRYPAHHDTVHPGHRLARSIPLATELFARRGYATGAVTENAMLSFWSGFGRGFDAYREERGVSALPAQGQIEETLNAALDWVEASRDLPFFLFVHTYQVHAPYWPPAKWNVFDRSFNHGEVAGRTARDLVFLALYAGEILYTDDAVGRFLRRLDELDPGSDTIVVVTSDHGEGFGEDGITGHSGIPTEPVMRIPLLIRAPGRIEPGSEYHGVVSLVDVLPTLLDLADIPRPPPVDGISLRSALRGKNPNRDRVVYAESRREGFRSVVARSDTHRFIDRENSPSGVEAFETSEGPERGRPVRDEAVIARGRRWISDYRRMKTSAPGSERQSIGAETAAKLRALGYTD